MAKVKLSHWQAYKNESSKQHRNNVMGEIYELFCYEKIIEQSKDKTIVLSNCVKNKKYEQFRLSKNGKILFFSDNIQLAEFDILGIDENYIIWYEITNSTNNKPALINELKRKKTLLLKIFPNKSIKLFLIVPKKIIINYKVEQIIIKPPKYDKYLKDEYMDLRIGKYDFIELYEFDRYAQEYNYIKNIIEESKNFYDNNGRNIRELKNNCLLERLYDYRNMDKEKFKYYDILRDKEGEIRIEGDKFFKNNKNILKIKKTYYEIKKILDIKRDE